MDSPRNLRSFIPVIFLSTLTACSYFSEEKVLERSTAIAEKRELWAYKRQACEESSVGAWMCTGSSKKVQVQYPWIYCECVDNQRVLQ
jgi:hypothetical protein